MDILTLEALERWLDDPQRPRMSAFGLDLRGHADALGPIDLGGCALLGCQLDARTLSQLNAQGGAIATAPAGLPFDPFRGRLYAIEDLYDRYDPAIGLDSWKASFDYSNYLWFMDEKRQLPKPLSTAQTVFGRVHDTALEGAVARFIGQRPVVGFMGGHDTPRNEPVFGTIASLARTLARRGLLVLTGGGPGLMEAANLGAFLAPYPDDVLGELLKALAEAPTYKDDGWLKVAWNARLKILDGKPLSPASDSLGVPTWLYGFEPPNVFASHHAKMFFNSLREDGLVTLASAGLIIGPGNAGTVQEIFQDATQNYYRKDGVAPTPMALLGEAYWSRPAHDGPDPVGRTKPLKPLIMALAGEKTKTDWSSAVLITDDVDAIVSLILQEREKSVAGKQTVGELWLARHQTA